MSKTVCKPPTASAARSTAASGRGSTATGLILAASGHATGVVRLAAIGTTRQYNGAGRFLYDQIGHPNSFIVYRR